MVFGAPPPPHDDKAAGLPDCWRPIAAAEDTAEAMLVMTAGPVGVGSPAVAVPTVLLKDAGGTLVSTAVAMDPPVVRNAAPRGGRPAVAAAATAALCPEC